MTRTPSLTKQEQQERRRFIQKLRRVERALDTISSEMITATSVTAKEHADTCDISMEVFRLANRMAR